MIKKELKDILPGLAIRLLIGGIVIAVFITVISFNSDKSMSILEMVKAFLILMAVVLIWIANSLGVTAFSSEYRDDAFEYLLSTPLSRSELIINKVLPRIIILLTLCIPYVISNAIFIGEDMFYNFPIIKPFIFLFTVILVFFCSFFLSLFSWKNIKMAVWLIYVFPIILMWYIVQYLFSFFNVSNMNLSSNLYFNVSLAFITIILGTAFYFIFMRFDLKSESVHKKKFGLYAGIPLVIIVIFGIISSVLFYK